MIYEKAFLGEFARGIDLGRDRIGCGNRRASRF